LNRIDRDSTAFFRHPRFGAMTLLSASFTAHRYDLHTHPTYVLGVVTRGVERLRVGSRHHVAPAGSLIFVNPEAPHDGEAGDEGGWAYRTWYPPLDLVAEIAAEAGLGDAPAFARAVIVDPDRAERLAAAHRVAEAGDPLAAEEAFLLTLRELIALNADGRALRAEGPVTGSARRLTVYDAVIRDDLVARIDLTRLAAAVGLTRFQVIRDIKRMTGLTPGTYVRGIRAEAARRAIAAGTSLADAAAIAGFADQSHLTRVFRALHGITPRMYQAAVRG
jgi:AraC-like DNA-binding protein